MYITPQKNEGTLISGKHWFSINLIQNQSFFSKLFSVKCCGCGQVRQEGDIDVEGLLENCNNSNINIKKKTKVDLGKDGEDDGKDNNDIIFPIIDELYQDYVLDLGDNIYLHKNTEIEGIKLIEKINK